MAHGGSLVSVNIWNNLVGGWEPLGSSPLPVGGAEASSSSSSAGRVSTIRVAYLLQELGHIVHLIVDDDPRRLGRVLLLDLGQPVVLDSLGTLVLLLTHDDHPERKVPGRLGCRSVLRSGGGNSQLWGRETRYIIRPAVVSTP